MCVCKNKNDNIILKMSKMKKSNKVLKKMFKKMTCDENACVYKKC